MMDKILKVGRWAVFVIGAGLFGLGVYLGNEGLTAAGGAMAGWAVPWVMDAKMAKAAHQVIDLLAHEDATPAAQQIAKTAAVKKLATTSGHKAPV